MTNTNINTTNDFDKCIDTLVEAMNNSYLIDDEGAPVDMDDEQKATIEQTVNQVKSLVTQILEPLFTDLQKKIQEQEARINSLGSKPGHISTSNSVNISMEGLPTVDQLISIRKGKDGKKITGYNLFTMWTMYCSKQSGKPSGFPEKGTWASQNQDAWKLLAEQVNKKCGVELTTAPKAAEPTIATKSKKVTAYNMFVKEYSAKNPGAPTPAKGTWKTIHPDEVKRYQALADAAKAQHA